MKQALSLFWETLSRPLGALRSLAAADSALKAPAIIFIVYQAAHVAVLAHIPPAFVPFAPAEAFSNVWYHYLAAAPMDLFVSLLLAAVLPATAVFFSRGRAASRVIAGAAALIAALLWLAAAQRSQAAALGLGGVFLLWALTAMRRRPGDARAMFSIILAASAISLALLPAQALSVVLNSKPIFEAATFAEALWTLWFFVKGLGVIADISAPRAAAAVFFTAALFGVLAFALIKLLPPAVAAILLIC